MALPTICQQRPRSPSLPLPSFIPFHPPIVHLAPVQTQLRSQSSAPSSPRRSSKLPSQTSVLSLGRSEAGYWSAYCSRLIGFRNLISTSDVHFLADVECVRCVFSWQVPHHNSAVFWDRCAAAASEHIPTITLTPLL